jgi:hypothetical protein
MFGIPIGVVILVGTLRAASRALESPPDVGVALANAVLLAAICLGLGHAGSAPSRFAARAMARRVGFTIGLFCLLLLIVPAEFSFRRDATSLVVVLFAASVEEYVFRVRLPAVLAVHAAVLPATAARYAPVVAAQFAFAVAHSAFRSSDSIATFGHDTAVLLALGLLWATVVRSCGLAFAAAAHAALNVQVGVGRMRLGYPADASAVFVALWLGSSLLASNHLRRAEVHMPGT